LCFASWYSFEFAAAPAATLTLASPPWQSVQPMGIRPLGCIVGASSEVWQDLHPALLRSASAGDCPYVISCAREAAGEAEWEPLPAEAASTNPSTAVVPNHALGGRRRTLAVRVLRPKSERSSIIRRRNLSS
jgi:hypothetical protein